MPYAIGLIKGGPNQAAGKKLIDYLMSTEVQAKVPDIFGIPGRTDVPLAGKNGEAVKQAIAGVKLIPVDWNHVMDKKADWTARWKSDVIGNLGQADRSGQAEVSCFSLVFSLALQSKHAALSRSRTRTAEHPVGGRIR